MKTAKFALMGCGRIAHCHADVIKHLGHSIEVVVARKDSPNIDSFAAKYAVDKKLYSVDSFLKYYCESGRESVNCILVCTPWDVTENILMQILPLGLPVMSEKPAVLSTGSLERLKQHEISNLFVAYNRRFYDFVPFLKNLIENETCLCADILSAEPLEMIAANCGEGISDYMLYFYTSHIIDLMCYLFGDIELRNIEAVGNKKRPSWICQLYSSERKCLIQMKILMDCPQNSYLKVFFEKKVAQICPFERLVVYNGLDRTEQNGKASYNPAVETEVDTDSTFKPGFLNQMSYFIENFVYRKNVSERHLEQLEKVTSFCDALVNYRRNYG